MRKPLLLIIAALCLALSACTQAADTTTTARPEQLRGLPPPRQVRPRRPIRVRPPPKPRHQPRVVSCSGTCRPGEVCCAASTNRFLASVSVTRTALCPGSISISAKRSPRRYSETRRRSSTFPSQPNSALRLCKSGEIDVLIRNTTFTSSRDGGEGATFLHTTFYDGQGMMVRADSGFTNLEDLANTAICVLSGTTTELNLATRFADIPFEPLTFEENEQIQAAFVAGQCDGWTSDKSQLAGVRSALPEAEGWPGSSGDPRGDLLEGASWPGRA